jgi:hypothetical protein
MPNLIGTTVNVETPLVRRARVSTAADPHPRIAATSGVHGFIWHRRYKAPNFWLKRKRQDADNL